MRLARDNYYAKKELHELFRKSSVWDEKLDALVINGTRTHNPNYNRIHEIAWRILNPLDRGFNEVQWYNIRTALQFFDNPGLTDEGKASAITAIQSFSPKAYAPGKKPTRIFRALCEALAVNNETCENFSYLYAQLADEMTSHKIDFKLFISLNPAHFITMSNPKADKRGCTLTSCHSLMSAVSIIPLET